MNYKEYIEFDSNFPNISLNTVIDETTEEGIIEYYTLLTEEYKKAIHNKDFCEIDNCNDSFSNCEVICKLTNICNQKCTYCFDKENQKKPRTVLSKEKIMKLLRLLKEENFTEIEWTWHGGEFLTVDKKWFDDVCFEMFKYAVKENLTLKFNGQSNGTLLDQEWKDILDKYNIPLGTSYDWSGQSVRGYQLPKKQLTDFYFIISVVTKKNVKNLISDFLTASKNEVPFSFNFVFGNKDHALEDFLDVDELIKEYKKYLNFFFYYNAPMIPERSALAYIRRALNRPAEVCNLDNCLYSNRICFNSDGKLYKCDDVSIEEMYICDIDEISNINEFFNNDKIEKLLALKQLQISNYCKECVYLPICGQGCLNCSFKESEGTKPYSAHCKFFKAIVPYIYEKLGNLKPEEFVKLNPTIKQYLIQQLYLPAYLKEELKKEYEQCNNI